MSIRIIVPAVMLACALMAVSASPAFAKDKGKAKAPEIQWEKDAGKVIDLAVKISMGDRAVIRDYLERDLRRHCPPGLAKKRNGCLPPGQAKKYRVGRTLGHDVLMKDLPDVLLERLSPLPSGYKYGRVDDDIVVMSRQNRMIVDAVSILMSY